jgi:hypothetical protein
MTFVAECRNSIGNPAGDSNSAQATVPVLFLISRIFTWIPGHGACANAADATRKAIASANIETCRGFNGTLLGPSLSTYADCGSPG